MCAVTSENEEFITYARCTSFRPAVFVSAKRFNKIRYDVLERFECGFFLDSSRTIDYSPTSKKGGFPRGMKVRPLATGLPLLPFREEKSREIHFIRGVKTRVLTTARRLLLLLRVVF